VSQRLYIFTSDISENFRRIPVEKLLSAAIYPENKNRDKIRLIRKPAVFFLYLLDLLF